MSILTVLAFKKRFLKALRSSIRCGGDCFKLSESIYFVFNLSYIMLEKAEEPEIKLPTSAGS